MVVAWPTLNHPDVRVVGQSIGPRSPDCDTREIGPLGLKTAQPSVGAAPCMDRDSETSFSRIRTGCDNVVIDNRLDQTGRS